MAIKMQGLYYITHIDNLPSILELGILSHPLIEAQNVSYKAVYDANIVSNRSRIMTPDQKSLWTYANFYFQPRNPMMFRVLREVGPQNIVVLKLRRSVLERDDIWLTDGNAAHSKTQVGLKPTPEVLKKIARETDKAYWTETDDAKRSIMAECLVPNLVEAAHIECVYISRNGDFLNKVHKVVSQSDLKSINVVVEPDFFFQPSAQWRLTSLVSLAQGDMFFSRMQTLTISVNTKGVMGKGLASRTRYQFPDVYVRYEDVCRSKEITTKTPFLYKRSKSLMTEMSDQALNDQNEPETWFLLFATKEHWKENSKLEYIVDGMNWLLENYQQLGITSLALPALGCGLGGLTWAEVGPILCSVANKMKIPVCIYLPSEMAVPPEQVQKDFLIQGG